MPENQDVKIVTPSAEPDPAPAPPSKWFLLLGFGWTIVVLALLAWSIVSQEKQAIAVALSEARALLEEIVVTRSWNARNGGVYARINDRNQPNPFLNVPDRDVTTKDGLTLTLINPAYMTRQIAELAFERGRIRFHLTSRKPIRPANAATEWEARALERFAAGQPEYFQWTVGDSGEQGFRYMAPLWVEQACLKCHAKQGYAIGDLRGGISVTFPIEPRRQKTMLLTYGLIWGIGILGILFAHRAIKRGQDQRECLIGELRQALAEVKTLQGLVPICAACKNVRNDEGYWEQIEQYVRARSQAEFTHSICPDCAKKLYPDLIRDEKGKKDPEDS